MKTTAPSAAKRLLSGNEAIALGAWEAGVRYAAAYPGTPSTEILPALARYPGVRAEWSSNEKVALDAAVGASFAGARALAAMKHVGVNVASDSLMTLSYDKDILAVVQARTDDVTVVEGLSTAECLGNSRLPNTVLLGALSTRLGVTPEVWLEVIEQRVPPKCVELNRKAFWEGRRALGDSRS